jgi:hypothetical protein
VKTSTLLILSAICAIVILIAAALWFLLGVT